MPVISGRRCEEWRRKGVMDDVMMGYGRGAGRLGCVGGYTTWRYCLFAV